MLNKPEDRYADRVVTPRPEDLEQLSSAGHGRIQKITNGVVVYEAWYRHWQLHGEHGAAVIKRSPKTGIVKMEAWMKDGRLHREGVPACIFRDPQTGVITREGWWLNDKLHRDDGPAHIVRDAKTGQVTCEEWWIGDVQISPSTRAVLRGIESVETFLKRLSLVLIASILTQ